MKAEEENQAVGSHRSAVSRAACRLPLLLLLFLALPLCAQEPLPSEGAIVPGQLLRALSFQDYNTRIVVAGTACLGLAGGVIGTFLLLRKRSLLSDTVSHATLPGIALAFMIATALGGNGKSLPILMAGALAFGLLAMGLVSTIRRYSILKDDAALAIVLSVLFGLGVSLLTLIQQMPTGNAAGLKNYIYGKTASLTAADMQWILASALLVGTLTWMFFKEFTLLCFDTAYATAQGWPVARIDALLMGLVVAVTVIGLQSVGLLLVVAILVIPAAAARFWTHQIGCTLAVAAGIGFFSGAVGALLSALYPRLPAGAMIVLTAGAFFLGSLIFGLRRGLLIRWWEERRLRLRVNRQHLLRAFYEELEQRNTINRTAEVNADALLKRRSWEPHALVRHLRRAVRRGWLHERGGGRYSLTDVGLNEALRIVRNHRLWETYLIRFADIAPGRVDRDADAIEHVVEPEVLDELEDLLSEGYRGLRMPESPHVIPPAREPAV